MWRPLSECKLNFCQYLNIAMLLQRGRDVPGVASASLLVMDPLLSRRAKADLLKLVHSLIDCTELLGSINLITPTGNTRASTPFHVPVRAANTSFVARIQHLYNMLAERLDVFHRPFPAFCTELRRLTNHE